jgi:hypothetical protein
VELKNINTQDALGTLAQIVHVEAGAQTGSTNSCSGRDSCSSCSNNGYNVVREESMQPTHYGSHFTSHSITRSPNKSAENAVLERIGEEEGLRRAWICGVL